MRKNCSWCCWSVVVCTILGTSLPLAAETVRLGDPQLTAGIPGDGPLTLDQAKQWLADPQNHEPLSVELPAGLAVGKEQIYIPEDNPLTRAKIELGRQLYFDKRLSQDASVSCADCHHPDFGYAFNTQFGVGVRGQVGNRNSPVAFNRILSREQFWDGRAATLEEQAIGPIANAVEMSNTHDVAVQFLKENAVYREQFAQIFGRPPHIDDVGRAIASFERTLVTGDSAYDLNEPVARMEKLILSEFDTVEEAEEEEPELYERYVGAERGRGSKADERIRQAWSTALLRREGELRGLPCGCQFR
jgi:cytochrome c peroxidase